MPSRTSKPRNSNESFAKREESSYSHEIPSREQIIQHLEKVGKPVAHDKLCKLLHLKAEEEIEGLRRRLIAMSRDGQLISNRRGVYGLAAHMDLIKGRVQGIKEGYGFFVPDDGSGDFFLNVREMERLFDGDKVLARFTGLDSRGRKEGTIVEILQRRFTEIVGRFYSEHGLGIVVPDSKRITHEILIPQQHVGNARDGQFVVAEIIEYPARRRKAIARIVEVLGDVSTPGLEIDIAVRSHDIPHQWPAQVTKETSHLPAEVSQQDHEGRFDLRDVPFVTIDGEDAKDFDDAVFTHRHQRGNWTLYVAIADVSHYVSINSALNEEAINRGTSVYFPGHVIPMLTEQLSNGLCSLKPRVDRLAMVCEMEISATGEMTDYSFYEAVIHSHARLTYSEVADIVQVPQTDAQQNLQSRQRDRHSRVLPHLENLYSLFQALHENRKRQGAMDFESTETRIVFGEDRKIREIVPVERTDAHRLIEECMLSANVATAQLLEASKIPALYRVHAGPNPDKLVNLREFLGGLGLYLGGGEEPSTSDYQQVLQVVAGRPDRHLLQTMLIRSMMQAIYQPENLGHFGLGFPAYTHFTSPIRRYPDLLVHRAIRFLIRNRAGVHVKKHAAAGSLAQNEIYPYNKSEMENFGVICSVAERRADAASYSVIDWLKCEYMQDHVGEDFEGTVSSVTSFGLFVELRDIYIEGLVHITALSNDYYHFDPIRHCLEGERRHNIYRLGDSVQVKVVRVDLDEKKIDLQMLASHSSAAPSKADSRNRQKDSGRKAHGNPADARTKRTGKKKKDRKPGEKAGKPAVRKSSASSPKKQAAPKKGTKKTAMKSPGKTPQNNKGRRTRGDR